MIVWLSSCAVLCCEILCCSRLSQLISPLSPLSSILLIGSASTFTPINLWDVSLLPSEDGAGVDIAVRAARNRPSRGHDDGGCSGGAL